MKIDFKKILKKFGENYDFIYDAERNNSEVAGYYDALNYFDDMMDNNTSFVDFIRKLVDIRGDFFSSDKEIVALMFALEDLRLLDAIESGKIEESKKLMKELVKPEIQLMVNRIIDNLIGEYSSKEWDRLSDDEKADIIKTEHLMFDGKSKDLSEVISLVIENMNHPFDVVFESKKSARKSLKEENNRQKVIEGIMAYFQDVFPIVEKDSTFRFSMYTKTDVKITIELFKNHIFVCIFNLNGEGHLSDSIEILREPWGTIEDEILYDSDAIYDYLEEYNVV